MQAVVGAGLVGSPEECLLAQRGMEVGSVGRTCGLIGA